METNGTLGRIMVRQMAALSVRMERSERQESFALAQRVRHAAEDHDQQRVDDAERLFEQLGETPRSTLRRLRRSPEGVDRLIEAWRDLRSDLTRRPKPLWTAWHRERLENLCGRRAEEAGGSRVGALSNAAWGDPSGLSDGEVPDDEDCLKAWGRARLVERIDEAIAELESHYETLDFETIDLDRAEAGERALFDPSREATLARRYEAEAARGFYRALKELRRAEAEAAERPEVAAPAPPPEVAREPLGSSRDRPGGRPREAQPSPDPARPTNDPVNLGNLGGREALAPLSPGPG